MFETHNSAEEFIPSDLTINGLRAWNSVHTRLHVPWLHAVYTSKSSDGYMVGQIAFLTYVHQLIQLDHQSDMKILEVNLVSPKHLNNKGGWKMESLREIWIGFEPDTEHQQEAEIFVLKNGDRYTDSAVDTNEANLLEKGLIFRA